MSENYHFRFQQCCILRSAEPIVHLSWKFCPQCGEQLKLKKCKVCKEQNCLDCGECACSGCDPKCDSGGLFS